MGAAIALQSAGVERRIVAVAAEDPFANFAGSQLRLCGTGNKSLARQDAVSPGLHLRYERSGKSRWL